MVFFTCNACGESLKKAQVDKHVLKCRRCEVLSCIDCGKDFWGDDYKDHNKCISEDQKYGGKGYEAKTNKGDVKQQQWMRKIQEAMNKPGVSPKLKEVLNQVSSYDNVPRKKAKFQNWMQNSLRIYNTALQDQVWEVFSAATSNGPEKPAEQQQTQSNTNGTAKADQNGTVQPEASTEAAPLKEKKKNKRERKEERQQKKKQKKAHGHPNGQEEGEQNTEPQQAEEASEKQKKKKKRKIEEEEDNKTSNGQTVEDTERKPKKSKKTSLDDTQTSEVADDGEGEASEPNAKGKFNWKGTIKAALRQSPEEGIAVKKLRKKVLAAYYSFSGDGNFRSEEELFSLFNKKISNNPKFKIVKDKVRLVK
ncbi:hypothetical protein ACEWY4_027018 [Coilia grayii]|uniref:Cell growth-regulating nucleolar protein n=1 Tax=Coilia grayii TaxID=363190 RepID=A0ABD1ISC4_9TELE